MSKIFLNKQLISELNLESGAFIKIFFYLPQTKREKIEYLSHFLQKYQLKLFFLTKEKRFYLLRYFQANANFMVQSMQPVSQSDFAAICYFLSLHVIVVSFSYRSQIWTISRFLKWQQVMSQAFLLSSIFNDTKEFNTNIYSNNLNSNQFVRLWPFFNQMIF